MSKEKRPTLTLKSPAVLAPESERLIDLAVYDVVLPCRQFEVEHKVAEVGHVSLIAEFVLRLLKSADGMAESDVSAFFGFDRRDMAYVLREIETHGYAERKDGRIWLTSVGHSLFRTGSTHPEIFEVERRTEVVGFDLLALAPQEWRFLDQFELRLPELKLVEPLVASEATRLVPKAFERFFSEIIGRRDPSATARRSLYSIDEVTAKERFSGVVRVTLRANSGRPSYAEANLDEWRPDHEREDREPIVKATSNFVEDLRVQRHASDPDAYRVLADLAPEFLNEFVRRDGLAVERYYREALARAGEVRQDRLTIPILGSFFTRDNVRRLFEVGDYGLRAIAERPQLGVWVLPAHLLWGATTALPESIAQIKKRLLGPAYGDEGDTDNCMLGLATGMASRHVEEAFDLVKTCEASAVPQALEILLVPHVVAAVLVNAPVGATSGAPVPLGFASFDARVLDRTHRFLLNRLPAYSLSEELHQRVTFGLSPLVLPLQAQGLETRQPEQ